EARRTNGFVTALEDEAGWLRYNQLFADALRRQLEREAPERLAAAHARASIWFAERDMPDEAIEHAIAAGDGPLAASLLADRWVGLVAERRQATLRNWLDRLPPDRGELGPF